MKPKIKNSRMQDIVRTVAKIKNLQNRGAFTKKLSFTQNSIFDQIICYTIYRTYRQNLIVIASFVFE